MTELLSELRRSPVAGDREVADLLDSLRPADGGRPRASEGLAVFIAERGSGVTPPAELEAPAGSPSLLVVIGGAADPKPARRRVLTGARAYVAGAAAIVVVAVGVATGGPSRNVVVRPTDSSTVAPAPTAPADQADPTPRLHHPVAPSVGSRPHRPRIHPAATTSDLAPALSTNPAASHDSESARASDDATQPEQSGDDREDERVRGTGDDGGDTSDGGGGDGRETSDGGDD
jgi:hypothetical protein